MSAFFDQDILYDICTFLSAKDIYNLSLTCKSVHNQLRGNDIYRLMFLSKFGLNSNPIGTNWEDKFKMRVSSSSKLYTWGSTDLGRLGYLIKDVPPDHLTQSRSVKLPTVVPNFNEEVIIDLKANGFSFQILTDRGIYYTGNDYRKSNDLTAPGPVQADARVPVNALVRSNVVPTPGVIAMPFRRNDATIQPVNGPGRGLGERSRPGNRHTNANLRLPPDRIPALQEFQRQQEERAAEQRRIEAEERRNATGTGQDGRDSKDPVESNFITKVKIPEKVTAMASGRQHFIALTDTNQIYTWDTGNSTLNGVKLNFPDLPGDPQIQKIKCGWNTSGFTTKEDLVVWYSRATVTRPQVDRDEYLSQANYLRFRIPDLIDFHLGCDFIIVLITNGAYRYSFDTMEYYYGMTGETLLDFADFEPMVGFNRWLESVNNGGTAYQFSKVTGCYNNFAIFANDKKSSVLFGNKQALDEQPQLIDLPSDVVEVEMGDYHYLALTDQGSLYSWGVESAGCGCLGVGDEKIKEGRNYKLLSPAQIPGKWVAICAGGWHSGGIGFE